jgi:hypothetical protein
MALALLCAPAFAAAQEGPGPEDEEEVGMMEDGPDESDMRPGMGGPGMGARGQMGPGMQQRGQGMDQDRTAVKKKMVMRQGKEGGFFPEERVLGVIKKHDPVFAKKVADLKETAPAKYRMVLQMSGKLFAMARMQQDETIEKDAVRTLALEFESKELSLKYNKASDSEKKSIRERLKVVLSDLFDLRSKGQEMRVKHMEDEIGRLKKNLEKRKASKAKIVEQRLEQLTGEGYGW